MEAIDNVMNTTLIAILVAATISPMLCPAATSASNVSNASTIPHSKLVPLKPRLAPSPVPLKGHAMVRIKHKSFHTKRAWKTGTARSAAVLKLAAKATTESKKDTLVARSAYAASKLGAFAMEGARMHDRVRVHPVGLPTAWKDKIEDAPKIALEYHVSRDEDCTCEAQQARKHYKNGEYEEALEGYKALGDKSLQVFGHKNSQYASALMWQGQCLHKLHRDEEARAYWQESLKLYKKHKPKAKAVAWLTERLKQEDF